MAEHGIKVGQKDLIKKKTQKIFFVFPRIVKIVTREYSGSEGTGFFGEKFLRLAVINKRRLT